MRSDEYKLTMALEHSKMEAPASPTPSSSSPVLPLIENNRSIGNRSAVKTKKAKASTKAPSLPRNFESELHFPTLLHFVLEHAEDQGYSDIISWHHTGYGFFIHKNSPLLDKVLKPWGVPFGSISSVRRRLQVYGFYQCTKSMNRTQKGVIYHRDFLFVRARPHLAKTIPIVEHDFSSTRLTKPVHVPEPNFDSINSMSLLPRDNDDDDKIALDNDNDELLFHNANTTNANNNNKVEDIEDITKGKDPIMDDIDEGPVDHDYICTPSSLAVVSPSPTKKKHKIKKTKKPTKSTTKKAIKITKGRTTRKVTSKRTTAATTKKNNKKKNATAKAESSNEKTNKSITKTKEEEDEEEDLVVITIDDHYFKNDPQSTQKMDSFPFLLMDNDPTFAAAAAAAAAGAGGVGATPSHVATTHSFTVPPIPSSLVVDAGQVDIRLSSDFLPPDDIVMENEDKDEDCFFSAPEVVAVMEQECTNKEDCTHEYEQATTSHSSSISSSSNSSSSSSSSKLEDMDVTTSWWDDLEDNIQHLDSVCDPKKNTCLEKTLPRLVVDDEDNVSVNIDHVKHQMIYDDGVSDLVLVPDADTVDEVESVMMMSFSDLVSILPTEDNSIDTAAVQSLMLEDCSSTASSSSSSSRVDVQCKKQQKQQHHHDQQQQQQNEILSCMYAWTHSEKCAFESMHDHQLQSSGTHEKAQSLGTPLTNTPTSRFPDEDIVKTRIATMELEHLEDEHLVTLELEYMDYGMELD